MTPQWALARHVVLDGAVNVRDVGGYQSSYGLQVARGLLFRGDALSQLSGLDRERLDRLGLRTVCLLYTSPSPRDRQKSRMPSSA